MVIGFLSRNSTPDVASCRFRQSTRVLGARQGDEAVLFDTARGRYFTLNDVGTRIWLQLERPSTLAELVAVVSSEYDVPGEDRNARALRDVSGLLTQLSDAGLIVAEPIKPRRP